MEYQGYPTTDELLRKQTESPDLLKALAYGIAAGAVGAALWYAVVSATQHEVGLVAIVIGWLVGQGVVLGSGRKRGRTLQLIAVGITLTAMVAAYYLILRDGLVAYVDETYGPLASAGVPWLLPADLAWEMFTGALADDMGELIFWAIALYTAFRIPATVAPAPVQATAAT